MKKFAQKNCRKMFHEAIFSEFPNSVLNFELDILLKKNSRKMYLLESSHDIAATSGQRLDILGCQDSRHGF